ncbi:MAG: P-loop NTPase, partial [Roseivivax sp.]|nr:P-loop NTPase [Roseivivax sp.]
MTPSREAILEALSRISLPDGGTLESRDMIRALTVENGAVRFVIEAPTPSQAQQLEPVRQAAVGAVSAVPGVASVSAVLTAHGPAAQPPSLKVGGHPKPQAGPMKPAGVARIIAVGSGKGGVGKSTVSSNLAVALARAGRRVGLLDADIYGPSQPRMMGVTKRPASPDGKIIEPLRAHGVTMMSIGLMLPEEQAVVWRGP